MRFPSFVLAGALAGLLAGCGTVTAIPPGSTTPVTTSQANLVATDVNTGIQAACADVNAAVKINPTSPAAPWGIAACATAQAVGALAQTSATVEWLGQLQTQIATQTPVAKVSS